MITLQNISKSFRTPIRQKGLLAAAKSLFHRQYSTINALTNISFSVNPGEIIGFIGPNGAGKSTTIKIMTGILTPDSGSCSILNRTPWKDRTNHVKHIGVVFGQRTQLWWDVPVIDSYELLKDIYNIPEKQYKETLHNLINTMNLQPLLNTPLRQLSLGQRMACEIAASLLHNPNILFLDEPTIGLDAVAKLAVRKFIAKLNQEKNVTVILTTHDMDDIGALTDRIILIGKGRILHDGSMREIRKKHDRERTLNLTFLPHENPVEIQGAQLLTWENEHATYRIDTDKTGVSETLARLGEELSIQDLTVESRQLEEIIADLYREHQV